jgi:predicted dehydrogenase
VYRGVSPVDVALIGAGNRGRHVFGAYALRHPERLRVVALAEPHAERRAAVAAEHRLAPEHVFADWRALFAALFPRSAAAPPVHAAIIATGDTEHVAPALAALDAGLHVLLEKPIALDPADCVRVVTHAERAERILQIGHVLRYTAFYARVQAIAASGALGRIQLIDLREHVGYWHMAHSYVRGKFRNQSLAAPFLLAKSCHDLDLLAWLAASPALAVSSFGGLGVYRPELAPPGAPERCSPACPAQASCPWDAERFYLAPDAERALSWPYSDLSADPSRAARERALATSHYGRCVFRCDNDVLDHQVVSLECASGLVATLGVHGTGSRERRTVRLSGSAGELRGVLQDGLIEVTRHGAREREEIRIEASPFGHSGGDQGLLDHFCDVVSRGAQGEVRASGRVALESHLLGFAAEQARRERKVVDMNAYRAALGVASSA